MAKRSQIPVSDQRTGGAAPAAGPDPAGLADAAAAAGKTGLPPVHLWNPPFCGDLDMRIARDGTWFYEGTPIGRARLVQLFASILRRDGDDYFLVTPVEKVGIRVDDAPFVAVDLGVEPGPAGDSIWFATNVGDRVLAGPDTPIRVSADPKSGEPAPYVRVRRNLDALIDRKTFYRLVELGRVEGDAFGVRSQGAFFAIGRAADLEA